MPLWLGMLNVDILTMYRNFMIVNSSDVFDTVIIDIDCSITGIVKYQLSVLV